MNATRPGPGEVGEVRQPFSPYQKRLFAFLSVATFFEGYDFFALSQLLPNLRAHFGLLPSEGALMLGVINAGTVLAYLVVERADRWGRRRVLMVTIIGYTLFTLLSGLAWSAVSFTLFQLLARVFLIGEWATSMVIAAEEFPAARRGTVIGVVSAAAGLGSIVCAVLVPVLLETPLGFRSVYLVGVVPLVLVAFARRGLKETARFEQRSPVERPSLFAIWRGPHRRRVMELGLIWFLCYICSQNAVFFWKEFAMNERGLTDADVGRAVAASALVAIPAAFAAGRFLDWVGRRVGGTVILSALSGGVFWAYSARDPLALAVALSVAAVGANTMLTVLNTLTTELFPTEQRAAAFAWTNNLIGRVGYTLSPFVIAGFVDQHGWGAVLRWTAIFPMVALALIWLLLPETRGLELEETAEVSR